MHAFSHHKHEIYRWQKREIILREVLNDHLPHLVYCCSVHSTFSPRFAHSYRAIFFKIGFFFLLELYKINASLCHRPWLQEKNFFLEIYSTANFYLLQNQFILNSSRNNNDLSLKQSLNDDENVVWIRARLNSSRKFFTAVQFIFRKDWWSHLMINIMSLQSCG